MSKICISVPKVRSGCYILRLNRQVVYVGQSGNVLARFSGHIKKQFDTVEIIWCDQKTAAEWERKLIAEHRPRYNRSLVPEQICLKKFLKHYKGLWKPNTWSRSHNFAAISGPRVKRYRQKCGIPLGTLAEASGLSWQSLRRLESGKAKYMYHFWNKLVMGFKRVENQVSEQRKGEK